MKALFVIIILAFTLAGCCGGDGGEVYICTGPDAECYHAREDCYGLEQCTHEVELVSRERAREMGRRSCGVCKPD